MKSQGYFNPPINEIRNLLNNRYKEGFPILKEIIQNANDGEATCLDFGIIDGFDGSVSHPLLKDPVVFFVNNGGFNKNDEQSIACFGIDANAGDSSKIGRFGLGQKSIFHLCEAFFYIARSSDIPDGCAGFINPWANSNGEDLKHPDWQKANGSDSEIIVEQFLKDGLIQSQKDRNYFILLVPLRRLQTSGFHILPNYYDDTSPISQEFENTKDQIAQILPVLRSLQEIHYWTSENLSLSKKFSLNCKPVNGTLERSDYPLPKKRKNESNIPKLRKLQGIISSSSTEEVIFAGQEAILLQKIFQSLLDNEEQANNLAFWEDLQKSPWWGKQQTSNENYELRDEPYKVLPHCSVVFSKQLKSSSTNKNKLKVQWSVFLPLADQADTNDVDDRRAGFEEHSCDGEFSYNLTIHGYFFLDSGRTHIKYLSNIRDGKLSKKTPKSLEEMIQQWNYLLATQGSLRQVLPALEFFVDTAKLSGAEIHNISSALKCSSLLKNAFRDSVCHDHQWVCRIKPSGSQWELIGVNETVRSLPSIPSESLWQAFPKLKNYAQDYCLTLKDKPNLLLCKKTYDWEAKEITCILGLLDPSEIFKDTEHLRGSQ